MVELPSTLLFEASERIYHQLGNEDRIARSNVVFCSLWDYSETERQVRKALERVKKYNIPELLSK
jgi:dephospho-CoA kinase